MKGLLPLVCSLVLTGASLMVAQKKPVSNPSQLLKLTIHLHGWAAGFDSNGYRAGKPIAIRCVWKNSGKKLVSFLLKDHDAYYGTLDHPLFIWARVTDSSGQVLTKSDNPNGVREGGWWSSPYAKPDFFIEGSEMPGDVISLKPGEEVTRIVTLDKVLTGLKTLPKSLEPGAYVVEILYSDALSDSLLLSNKLEIKVVADR